MKKITRTLALVLIGLAVNSAVMVQKIAHIQLDSLITLMPETKKAQDIAQDYLKQLEKEITMMQTQFQTKLADYQTNGPTYSDLVKKNKEAGYKYVLDTSTGMVLYSEASDDILPLVKKKLDTMPEAVLPGTAPANN